MDLDCKGIQNITIQQYEIWNKTKNSFLFFFCIMKNLIIITETITVAQSLYYD